MPRQEPGQGCTIPWRRARANADSLVQKTTELYGSGKPSASECGCLDCENRNAATVVNHTIRQVIGKDNAIVRMVEMAIKKKREILDEDGAALVLHGSQGTLALYYQPR
jgi:hypothetical protein